MRVFTSISGYNSTLVQQQLTMDVNSVNAPTFCLQNGSASALFGGPHWVYGTGQEWQTPQCVGYLHQPEFTDTGPSYAAVRTNFVQKGYQRTCDTKCYDGGDYHPSDPCLSYGPLMAPEFPTSANETQALFYAFPSNCSTSVTSYGLAYVYLAENVTVSFTPVYSTSWGTNGLYDALQLVDSKGAAVGDPSYGGTYTFATLTAALEAAGVTLDTPNADLLGTSGGQGLWNGTPSFGTNSGLEWPSYRLTGVALAVDIETSNFRTTSPVNFNVTGRVRVRVASPGAWATGPTSVTYLGGSPGQGHYDSQWMERQWQGVQLHFGATGMLGHPDAFAALSSILSAFLIVLLAVAITDAIGLALSEEFQHEKFEDDGERKALDGFLEKEAVRPCLRLRRRMNGRLTRAPAGPARVQDHGVPFNFEDLKLRQANGELSEECYESAIFRLEKEIDELRCGGEKVRDATALIAEELDLGQLLSDKESKPKPVCKLVSGETKVSKEHPDGKFFKGSDTIELYPGENVIGRGLGDIKVPTVSRKQVCIRIDAANPDRAFINSMRKDNAPSYPMIKRGDATGPLAIWKRISSKGQSIRVGDTIGLQQKVNALGQPMTAICEYQLCPLSTEAAAEESWFKKMFGF